MTLSARSFAPTSYCLRSVRSLSPYQNKGSNEHQKSGIKTRGQKRAAEKELEKTFYKKQRGNEEESGDVDIFHNYRKNLDRIHPHLCEAFPTLVLKELYSDDASELPEFPILRNRETFSSRSPSNDNQHFTSQYFFSNQGMGNSAPLPPNFNLLLAILNKDIPTVSSLLLESKNANKLTINNTELYEAVCCALTLCEETNEPVKQQDLIFNLILESSNQDCIFAEKKEILKLFLYEYGSTCLFSRLNGEKKTIAEIADSLTLPCVSEWLETYFLEEKDFITKPFFAQEIIDLTIEDGSNLNADNSMSISSDSSVSLSRPSYSEEDSSIDIRSYLA